MNRRTFTASLVLMAFESARRNLARGEDVAAAAKNNADAPTPSTGNPNVPLPTLGGKQFWGDELFFREYRIQRNVLTGHCRLLDGRKVRQAWGTYDECYAKLEEIKQRRNLPPMSGRAVVVLHGLFRSGASMERISRYLQKQGNFSVFNVTYPTTRTPIAAHAQRLAGILEHLHGMEEQNFVGHSLGNVVVRHYLADQNSAKTDRAPDPRIKRIVMLAPPNNGAKLAEMLGRSQLFQVFAGEPGSQLGHGWADLEAHLATPNCEFGIIAGGLGNARGYNPLLGEDNDLVISVETTRLAGAADFAVVPSIHTFIKDDPKAQEYALRFLEHGYFISPDKRQPILPGTVG